MVRKGLMLSTPLLLMIVAISVYGWMTIPAGTQIPSRFDFDGNVSGTMDRNLLLLTMPALALLVTLIFASVPVLDPRRRNLEQSTGLYFSGWVGTLSILLISHGTIVYGAVTKQTPGIGLMLITIATMLIIMGNYLAKSRSSWFLGVRTPWTLSSEHAWVVANRLCGWLFVLTGALTIFCTLIGAERQGLIVMIGGAIFSAIAAIVVSFFAWRNDPEQKGEG